jgi:hypothetical protein
MTRNQIISIVNKLTENALVDQIDFSALLTSVEQEFCAEKRFWWRKKRLTFATVAGTDTYDLSSITTVPANAGPYVEEITFVGRENALQIDTIDPIFDDAAIAAWGLDTAQDKPGVYTIEMNSLSNNQVLRVHRVPSGVFTLHVFFWAMPNPAVDASDDVVYVTPPIWHHALQTGLEKEVWRLKYGQQDPKYATALNLYNKKVEAAKLQAGFDASKTQSLKRKDGMAIRSTR